MDIGCAHVTLGPGLPWYVQKVAVSNSNQKLGLCVACIELKWVELKTGGCKLKMNFLVNRGKVSLSNIYPCGL